MIPACSLGLYPESKIVIPIISSLTIHLVCFVIVVSHVDIIALTEARRSASQSALFSVLAPTPARGNDHDLPSRTDIGPYPAMVH